MISKKIKNGMTKRTQVKQEIFVGNYLIECHREIKYANEKIKNINEKIKLIISTTAFGMGIDQIVKCVIIFGCPSSIEEYYQQIGRGGRDGKECETILFFEYKNYIVSKKMLENIKYEYPLLYKSKLDNLYKMSNYIHLKTCRRKFILEYFNETCDFFTCNNCDNCCEKELIDYTNIIWNLVMNNSNINKISNEIKNKYLLNSINIFLFSIIISKSLQ
jgi:superfamily II DNA helicase RecQ